MQASKAASERPVSAADACLRCPTTATMGITITTIGTNVPNTIAAVEIFLGGFGGGVGPAPGRRVLAHQHDCVTEHGRASWTMLGWKRC
jgi:hypothetical protein